jgi:hypothetical protein
LQQKRQILLRFNPQLSFSRAITPIEGVVIDQARDPDQAKFFGSFFQKRTADPRPELQTLFTNLPTMLVSFPGGRIERVGSRWRYLTV